MKTTIEERQQYAQDLKNVIWEMGKNFRVKNLVPPNRIYAGRNVAALMTYCVGITVEVTEGAEKVDSIFGWKIIEVNEPDYLAVGLVAEQN